MGGQDPLEEEMASCSSILAWEIPWTEEPGGLQSMGSHRVRLDLETEHTHVWCTPGVELDLGSSRGRITYI